MDEATFTSIAPREPAPGASSRLLSFHRVRDGAETRFLPGAGARLHFANLDADTLELPDLPPGFLVRGDSVRVQFRGRTVFRGELTSVRRSFSRGLAASDSATLSGPWAKMARCVLRQYWCTGPNRWDLSSRLVLNQSRSGAALGASEALQDVLSRDAAACGFALGSVNVSGVELPPDECRDITVADAVRRILRLFPDTVARFDYSTDPPTLSILRSRPTSDATNTAYGEILSRELTLDPNPVTGVDLELAATGTVDGVEYRQIAHQRAGDASAGNPDCLYATLALHGASGETVTQSWQSVTEDIPENLNDADWWRTKHPRLANVASDALSISDAERTGSLPRISAASAGEITALGLHAEVARFTCRATVHTADDVEEDIFLTMQFLTTDAEGTAEHPKTYRWTASASATSGESVPANLASAILRSRMGEPRAGRLSVRIADAFPVMGSNSDGLLFQSVDVDCDTLVADIALGAPAHLPPEDMAGLLSSFRNRRTFSSYYSRRSGRPEDDARGEVGTGGIPPLSSTEFAPGTKAKTTVAASSGGGRIVLDPSSADPERPVQLRTLTIRRAEADGGDLAVRVLADRDAEIDSGGTSAPGGATATISAVTAVSYDTETHYLSISRRTLTVRDGLVTAVGDETAETVTQAVEESA